MILYNHEKLKMWGNNMNSYNILVVEDEIEIAKAIEAYLLNQGYNVFLGNNGIDAVSYTHLLHINLLAD